MCKISYDIRSYPHCEPGTPIRLLLDTRRRVVFTSPDPLDWSEDLHLGTTQRQIVGEHLEQWLLAREGLLETILEDFGTETSLDALEQLCAEFEQEEGYLPIHLSAEEWFRLEGTAALEDVMECRCVSEAAYEEVHLARPRYHLDQDDVERHIRKLLKERLDELDEFDAREVFIAHSILAFLEG